MQSRSRLIAFLVALSGVACAPMAHGDQLFSYFGSTGNGPTFTRPPTDSDGNLTAADRLVRYHARPFQVGFNTNCIVDSIQNDNFDGVLNIYRGGFDPQSPLQNLIKSAADIGALGIGSTRSGVFAVNANTPYIVVTSGFRKQPLGPREDFQNTISCDSTPTFVNLDPFAEPRAAIPLSNCSISTLPACVDDPPAGQTPSRLGRFRISVTFSTLLDPTFKEANLVPFSATTSALFWFFRPDNWEVQVKVLNFCNDSSSPAQFRTYRVFAAGITDVNVKVTVVDTLPGGSSVTIENTTPNPFNFQVKQFPLSSCP